MISEIMESSQIDLAREKFVLALSVHGSVGGRLGLQVFTRNARTFSNLMCVRMLVFKKKSNYGISGITMTTFVFLASSNYLGIHVTG